MKKNHLCAFLIIIFFLVGIAGGCSSKPGVSRVNLRDEEQKVPNHGGRETSEESSGKKENVSTVVREITPPADLNKSLFPPSQPVSRKDQIRLRFPGKKVIFPDEIPLSQMKPEYRVGVDDVISVHVWNNSDLTFPSVMVRSDGMISFPLVGNIRVEGLTIPEIEDSLTEGLRRFLTRPQVSVSPKEMNSQRVFLIGPLRRPHGNSIGGTAVIPGVYIKAGHTLLEAISDVEFFSEVDLSASYIIRGEVIIPVNIKALLKGGDLSQNLRLEPGDRIIVQTLLKEVNVLGEVYFPSKYKVKMDDTVLDALSYAKGVKRESADLYTAYVARKKEIMPVNLKRLLDFGDMNENLSLEDEDTIFVPNIDEKKYYLLGEVGNPGVFHYKDSVDIIEAIARGGGFLTTAWRRQVFVVRGDVRSPQLYEIDVLAMMEGQSIARFPLQRGDIVYAPRTYIADWNVFLNQVFPTFQGVVLMDLLRRR